MERGFQKDVSHALLCHRYPDRGYCCSCFSEYFRLILATIWRNLMVWLIFLLLILTGAESMGLSSKPVLTKKDIDEMMTSLANWGRWGKSDELGALNLITPPKRKQAASLVRE